MASSDGNDPIIAGAALVYTESGEVTTSADGAANHDTTTMPPTGANTLPLRNATPTASSTADIAANHNTTSMPLSGAITLPLRPTTPAILTTASYPPTAPTSELLWPVSPHDMATEALDTLTLLQHDLANLHEKSPWFITDTPTTLTYDSMADLFVKTAQVLRIVRDLTSTPPIEVLLSEPECAVLVRNVASQLLHFAADSTILAGEYVSLKGTVALTHSGFLEKDSQEVEDFLADVFTCCELLMRGVTFEEAEKAGYQVGSQMLGGEEAGDVASGAANDGHVGRWVEGVEDGDDRSVSDGMDDLDLGVGLEVGLGGDIGGGGMDGGFDGQSHTGFDAGFDIDLDDAFDAGF
ncbi:hypothetical protein C1H76_4150 [Elsinoe australis]|uniref:Uncharacterized protein n=1 Tax=Elsinoe australis TaxID=40998 RepID=A0A4U7B4E3_9PEZI|nr:hypothetical protein C1H76_4150 [Elsinoe australis]